MTWGAFKALVEAKGVTDSDEIDYIDVIEADFDHGPEVDVEEGEPKRFSVHA